MVPGGLQIPSKNKDTSQKNSYVYLNLKPGQQPAGLLLVPPGGGNRKRKESGNNFGPTISVEPISASKDSPPVTHRNRKRSDNNNQPSVEPLSGTSKEHQELQPQNNRNWKASAINFNHIPVVEPLSATSKDHPDSEN